MGALALGARAPHHRRRSSSSGTSTCSPSCSAASAAFDAPARQTFVAELVGDADLSNAVALNSTSFNAARMIGPAIAGLIIAAIGTGWVFLINGASFVRRARSRCALLRRRELHPQARARIARRGSFVEGLALRLAAARTSRPILVMLFLIGTFGLNFPIFISTMAVSVFHADACRYGLLSSIMAIGTVAGALLAARRATGRSSARCSVGCGRLRARLHAGRARAQLLALRRRARRHRRGGADRHQRRRTA